MSSVDNINVGAEIENILDRLAVRMYDEGQLDKPSLMGRQVAIVKINEAKAQLTALIDTATREAIRLTWLESAEGWNNEYWGQELSEEEVIQEVTKTILAQLQEQSGGSDDI